MVTEPWLTEPLLAHVHRVLVSYRHWLRKDLIVTPESLLEQGHAVFEAPFPIVSHGPEADPILNYANRLGLSVFEATWDEFTLTPSRLTAEPGRREERMRVLAEVITKGYIEHLSGPRISCKGHRFLIKDTTVWNVLDEQGHCTGQAAAIHAWQALDQ
jgi:hypothetical protein